MKTSTTAEQRRTVAVWIATVGGVGYFPIAPGTIGSAVGVGLVAALNAADLTPVWRNTLLCAVIVLVFFPGVWAAGQAEKFFGKIDPGHVVIDELAGQMMTFLVTPVASWKILLAGFGLFRLFDVVKPFPARRAERLAGGWGIMIDDLIAGAYALGALALLGHLMR